jgi:hypothetical protein
MAIESGNWRADGQWDPSAEWFSHDELDSALALRQSVFPDPKLKRKDRCPHTAPCQSIDQCVQWIAWYRRHQQIIETR